ncbi:MAG: rod shape-determining protein RodA [Parcubacteria group bacterium]|nr:rod shape-determining protein RodA [Parcubacteria group bacterium]
MNFFYLHLKKIDWILLGAISALCLISLAVIFNLSSINFHKQLIWFGLGIFILILISLADYRILKTYPAPLLFIYFLSSILLLGVIFFGQRVRGSLSWFNLGLATFQPTEIAKPILVLLLAKYFSLRHIEMYRIRHLVVSGIYAFLPIALLLAQPDLGSAVIFGLIWLGMVLLSGIKSRHLLAVILIFGIISVLAWNFFLADYQKGRIMTFLRPETDFRGRGYQARQTLVAAGSGGFFGLGLGQGYQARLGFLPEPTTDFIFSAISEELGLAAGIFIFFLYGIIFWRIMKIGLAADNNFARLYSLGLGVMLAANLAISIGMNLGLLPITGIPTPFLSYGGSYLISLFLAFGILQGIHVRNRSDSLLTLYYRDIGFQ